MMNKSSHTLYVFIIVLMDLIALGMIIPLSPYLARSYGADGLQVGLLMSIYSVVQSVASPLWGMWSDRIGRKPVLICGLIGTAFSYLWFSLAPNLTHLFFARALAGACGVNVSTSFAFIADTTSSKDRSKSMALIGAAFGLGFIIGPALGGVLGAFQKQGSLSIVAFGAFIVCLIGFILAFFLLEETRKKKVSISENRWKNIFKIGFRKPKNNTDQEQNSISSKSEKSKHVIKTLFIFFILSLSLTVIEAPLFLLMKDDFKWPQHLSSWGFSYIGFILALTQGFFVRLWIPKWGENKINKWGFFLLIFGFFGLCLPKVSFIAGAVTIMALGYALSYACLTGSISILTKQSSQGGMLGLHQSLSSLARILGPALGGWMYRDWSHSSPFFVAGVLAVFGLLFSFLFQKSIPSSGKINWKTKE